MQMAASGNASNSQKTRTNTSMLSAKDTSPSRPNRLLIFFAGVKQRLQAPISARANRRSCPMYQLPTEPHLHIAACLHDSELLSYAYCSQRTTFLVSRLQPRRSVKGEILCTPPERSRKTDNLTTWNKRFAQRMVRPTLSFPSQRLFRKVKTTRDSTGRRPAVCGC